MLNSPILIWRLALTLFVIFFSVQTSANTLNIVTENWPPFNYQAPSGEITGIATDNVKAVMSLTGLSYQITVSPWVRSFHLAKTQPNTLLYSIYRSEEREPYFHWFCPILGPTPIYLYRLATNNITANSLSEILDSQLHIGVMREDNSHQFLRSMGFIDGKQLDISVSESINFNKLFAGRIDFVVQSEVSMVYRLKKLGKPLSSVSKVTRIHSGQQSVHCMALNKNSSPELVEKIKRAFARWQQENPLTGHSLANELRKLPES